MKKNKTVETAFRYYAVDRNAEDRGFEAALEYDSMSCEAMDDLDKLIMENVPDTKEGRKLLHNCFFYANKAGFYAGFEMAMDLFTAAKGKKAKS